MPRAQGTRLRVLVEWLRSAGCVTVTVTVMFTVMVMVTVTVMFTVMVTVTVLVKLIYPRPCSLL